jgi:hypothetical protein
VIPDARGALPARALVALTQLPSEQPAIVGRIADQEEGFLQFIDQHELRPGRQLVVLQSDLQAGVLRVRLDNEREFALGVTAAAKIEVEPLA